MSGGRLQARLLAAGAVVAAFQLQDAVTAGMLDGGHGVSAYWYGKNKAFRCSAPRPRRSAGMPTSLLGWFYYGGGEELYKELAQRHPQAQPRRLPDLRRCRPSRSAGSRRRSERPDDIKGLKYRTVGLAADLFKEMGAAVTHLAGRRDRAGDGARRDRRVRVQQPDLGPPLRLPGRRQELHDSAATTRRLEFFEIIFNKAKYDALRQGAAGDPQVRRRGGSADMSWKAMGQLLEGPASADQQARGEGHSARRSVLRRPSCRPGTRWSRDSANSAEGPVLQEDRRQPEGLGQARRPIYAFNNEADFKLPTSTSSAR